ncbi:LysR family transcriptional regulator [Sphingomonas sp. TF3]|uniref:LysR family transcriptional regulator n=1 Tax=Sphingomonas sp. TF3 TaxID=2495580 RepID=UPI0021AF096D|nr:LysR family transcriptional regulator [Sphingomonas sp. TF3]
MFGFFPSLRCLRAFLAVCQLESISQASVDLNLSQSAVTQAIARLEQDLDCQLFERRSKGSYLTEVGNILKNYTDVLFVNMEEALRECMSARADPGAGAARRMSRRITNSQIIALISIKDSGSFLQAARRVGVAQPTIHRTARALECNLGVQLFSNTARGSAVNELAYRLANRLQLMVRELEGAYERIEAQKLRERGRILVGGLLLAGSGFLASAISAFSIAHPDVNVDIATASYDVLLEKLRAGSIDFIVGMVKSPPPADDVVEEILAPDPYIVVARKGHPLDGKYDISSADLACYEWVMPGQLTARRTVFEQLFANTTPAPHTGIETYSLTILLLLLAESDRMTVLTESQILLDQSLGHNLSKIDYKMPPLDAHIGVTTRKYWTPSEIQGTFLDFLRHGPMTDRLLARVAGGGARGSG